MSVLRLLLPHPASLCKRVDNGLKIRLMLGDPLGTHLIVCYYAKDAFRWLPAHLFSCSYGLPGFFHGGNTGSNPVGDANSFQQLSENPLFPSRSILRSV